MIIDKPCCQIAYFVPDVRAAALEHHRTYGSGPFYIVDQVVMPFCQYRGKHVDWDLSSAFGQWGDVQIEFNQQNDDAPSVFHDVFPSGSGRYGLHNLGFIVDDLWAVAASFEQRGSPVAVHARMGNGIEALLVDTTASNGHLLELFAPSPPLLEFFDFIREQSIGFDGAEPVRSFDA